MMHIIITLASFFAGLMVAMIIDTWVRSHILYKKVQKELFEKYRAEIEAELPKIRKMK